MPPINPSTTSGPHGPGDLYIHRNEDFSPASIARLRPGPNGGLTADTIAKFELSGKDVSQAELEALALKFAAAPDLHEAVAKQVEWFEKERAGPDYGGLCRDTHPEGETIWSRWWNEQLDLCSATQELSRAALSRSLGEA